MQFNRNAILSKKILDIITLMHMEHRLEQLNFQEGEDKETMHLWMINKIIHTPSIIKKE